MELNEFKKIWKEEQEELVKRVEINERRIEELTFNKSKSSFEKLLSVSIIGRNLAIVYFLISARLISKIPTEYIYSIPAAIGGLAMLYSFYQHRSLKKVNFSLMSILELQKTINKFRMHTLKHAKYDKAIVSFWLITIAPMLLKFRNNIDIYSEQKYLMIYIACTIVTVLVVKFFPFDIYKRFYVELLEAEDKLNEINKYEEN